MKWFVFCGTFPRITSGGRYPPPCPMVTGLSSFKAMFKAITLFSYRLWYSITFFLKISKYFQKNFFLFFVKKSY